MQYYPSPLALTSFLTLIMLSVDLATSVKQNLTNRLEPLARKFRYGPYNYERTLGQRSYKLEAQVGEIVSKTDRRLTAVVRASVIDLVEEANTPGPSKRSYLKDIAKGLGGRGKKKVQGPIKPTSKGGRMRVDTGFLRASGKASLTGMPTGPVRGEMKEPNSYPYNADIAETVIKGVKIGSTIFYGWTANYAKYREAYDGFLYGAIQNWQRIVDKNVAKLLKVIQ